MEKDKWIRFGIGMGIVAGSIVTGAYIVVDEIQHQGEIIQADLNTYIHDEGQKIKTEVDTSVDGATEDLKEYIGSLTLEDLMD